MAVASMGVGVQPYLPIKVPSCREAHLKAIAFGIKAANAILPSPLCAGPMLPLVSTLAIFKAMLNSPSVVPKDKEQVAEAGEYLAERLAAMAMLVDKSIPTVAAFYGAIPCGKGGGGRGLAKTLLFDITCGLAKRVLLTKLVELDGDVSAYLTVLIVAALGWAGKTLVVLEGMQITMIIMEAFNNMFLKEASHSNDNYGLVSR